jgi:hypothetical protein
MERRLLRVLVISLAERPVSLSALRQHFPAAAVWPAVDLRGATPEELLADGLIDVETEEVLKKGRKHHWSMPCPAAVGLAASTREALRSGDGPLLLCEEDCLPQPRLAEQVSQLLATPTAFDAAVFGPRFRQGDLLRVPGSLGPRLLEGLQYRKEASLPGWAWPLADFECTHCVLYTAEGRRRVADLLEPPSRLQVDAALSLHGKRGLLRVLVQTRDWGATQTLHFSRLQDACPLCFVPARALASAAVLGLAALLLLAGLRLVARLVVSKPPPPPP